MSAYQNRMTEFVAYCPKHFGIGFPSYHIGYELEEGKQERVYECSQCGYQFTEPHGQKCDTR
jgi:hypothetical protein